MATYTSAGSGLWSAAATWVGGVKPPTADNHRIIIAAGHTVTYDEALGDYGDDTTGTVGGTTDGAIQVNGTLRFSRAVSTVLICRGTVKVPTGGWLDMGDFGSTIPGSVTAELRLNSSPVLAANKHILTTYGTGRFTAASGVARTRRTVLAAAVGVGATSIPVTDATNWAAGDTIVLAPTGAATTFSERTISGAPVDNGNGTWTVNITAALTIAHAAGGRVGNFSSNVVIRPASLANPCSVRLLADSAALTPNLFLFDHVQFRNLGSTTAWNGVGNPGVQGALSFQTGNNTDVNPIRGINNSAFLNVQAFGFVSFTARRCQPVLDGCVFLGNTMAYMADASFATVRNFTMFGGTRYANGAFGVGGIGWTFEDGDMLGATAAGFDGLQFGGTRLTRVNLHHGTSLLSMTLDSDVRLTDCRIGTSPVCDGGNPATADVRFDSGAITRYQMIGTTLARDLVIGARATGNPDITRQFVQVTNRGGDVTRHEYWDRFKTLIRDNAVQHRSASTHRMTLVEANGTATHDVTFFAAAGATIRVLGALRRDANYAGATLPSVTISGNGLAPVSYTMTGAAGAWEAFDLSITNTGPAASLTLRLSAVSTSVATPPVVEMSGVIDPPYVLSARHYGFLFDTSFGRTVDARSTLTEAAARALASLATLDDLFDALSVYAVDNQAAALPYSTAGTEIDLGALNVVVDPGASPVLAISGGTLTIAASALAAGAKFRSFRTTGNVGTAGGASIAALYTSAAGSSARLEVNNLTAATVYVRDSAGVQRDYQASVTGTYTLVIPPGATGTWRWVAKRPGFRHATGTFLPGNGGLTALSPSLPQKLNPDGSAMYLGTSSPLCSVSFSGTSAAFLNIGNGAVALQAAFDESEDALITAAGMAWLAGARDELSQFNSASGDFLFMTSGWRLRRAAPGDVNATLNAFAQSADGAPVDGTNGGVLFLTSDSATAIAAAVWGHMTRSLTGITPANVVQVTGATIEGTGTEADPWGPPG